MLSTPYFVNKPIYLRILTTSGGACLSGRPDAMPRLCLTGYQPHRIVVGTYNEHNLFLQSFSSVSIGKFFVYTIS